MAKKIEYISDIDPLTMNIDTILNLNVGLKIKDLNEQDSFPDNSIETEFTKKKLGVYEEIN